MLHYFSARPSGAVACMQVCLLMCLALSGCQKKTVAAADPPPPEVFFVRPSTQTVTQHEEFSGRTTSSRTVEIHARVSGYLAKANFQDGADVKEGDVLFEIEDSPFLASLAQAEATVKQMHAHMQGLKLQLQRSEKLIRTKAITQEELETLTYQTEEAEASKAAAESARDQAKINVTYTKVRAPFSGRINRRQVDPGNLVKADMTVLATIVAPSPIYGYFDFDERTILQMRRSVEQGKLKAAPDFEAKVEVALAGEENFSLHGKINWVDNQIDPGTGTLRSRVAIENPNLLLSPGMFVRLRVPVGPQEPALMIPEESLGSDQGQRYVYIINANNEIEYRRVDVGWVTEGRRVIRSGLKLEDRVVVTGLQRIRPKTLVAAKPYIKTPAAQQPAEKDKTPAEKQSGAVKTTETAKPVENPIASKH
ncbi:MAG: mexA [Planctomycetaceae bacterium]|nr:mexA [Planctomycetaceae bacterium]